MMLYRLAVIQQKHMLFKLKLSLFALVSLSFLSNPLQANTLGTGTQNFTPASGFHDFSTVNSSDTLPNKSLHLGLFLNNATNTLPYGEEVADRDKRSNQLTGADVLFGYGLTDRFHLGLSAPFVVNQSMDESEVTHGEFAKEGNTDVKVQAKLKVLGKRDRSGLALLVSAIADRTGSNPHRGENVGMSYVAEFIGDIKAGRLVFAGNLGYKIQDKGEPIEGSLYEPFGNMILYSAAAGYYIKPNKTKIFVEMFGDRPTDDVETVSDRETSTLEALFGVKHKLQPNLAVNAGLGRELMNGTATPDLRIYAGMNWLITGEGKKKPKLYAKKKVKKKKKRKKRRKKRAPAPTVDTSDATVALADLDLYDEPKAVPAGGALYVPTQSSTAPVPTLPADEVFVINDVNFAFDSDHEVLKGGLYEIDKVASHIASKGNVDKVVIEGHTCHMGTHGYNENLSFRRAKVIRWHLIKKYGFSPDSVIAVGFGEVRPTASNGSERGRRMNRRVEFKIYEDETLTQAGY